MNNLIIEVGKYYYTNLNGVVQITSAFTKDGDPHAEKKYFGTLFPLNGLENILVVTVNNEGGVYTTGDVYSRMRLEKEVDIVDVLLSSANVQFNTVKALGVNLRNLEIRVNNNFDYLRRDDQYLQQQISELKLSRWQRFKNMMDI